MEAAGREEGDTRCALANDDGRQGSLRTHEMSIAAWKSTGVLNTSHEAGPGRRGHVAALSGLAVSSDQV